MNIPAPDRVEIESLGDVHHFDHKDRFTCYSYRRALDWILAHGDDEITAYHCGGVMDLIHCKDVGSKAILWILVRYNQHPWLWERMTFHALAEAQRYGSAQGWRTLTCERVA